MGVCQAWWAEDLRSLENVCALLVCDDEGATYSTRPFLRDRKEKKLSLNLELWRNILESPSSLCGLISRRATGYPGLSDIWRWHNAMMPDLVAMLCPPPPFFKEATIPLISINFWFHWGFMLCEGFLSLQQVGANLHWGAWVSHCCDFSCCEAQL